MEAASPSSQASADSTTYLSADTLRLDLEQCLNDLQSAGDFALFEPLASTVTPGLWIKGAGTIGLPLSERDAQAIIAASHQAPYGKGSETLVDVNVRKTWELAPDSFETRNPEWGDVIKNVLAKVRIDMGIQGVEGGVRADLYKMLLYDKGAMFKPHQEYVSHYAQRVSSG
jgi:hypothetical protein